MLGCLSLLVPSIGKFSTLFGVVGEIFEFKDFVEGCVSMGDGVVVDCTDAVVGMLSGKIGIKGEFEN